MHARIWFVGAGLFAVFAPAAAAFGAGGEMSGSPAVAAYGFWVLAPAVVAIGCAVLTRQVVPSLMLGILLGGGMVFRVLPENAGAGIGATLLGAVALGLERYVVGALNGPESAGNVKVVLFTMMIAGMVGIMARVGATRALVDVVARRASTRRRGQVTTWAAGLLVFFDDYANSMIVGPTMRPITDRLRISRAKLAYIVDSTAAPVASIALIGTWVGAEIGYIQAGLDTLEDAGVPPFLSGVTALNAFVWSLPYRFYAILAIVAVFVVAVLGRDFGPMLRHEREALRCGPPQDDEPGDTGEAVAHWLHAAVPITALVGVTLAILIAPGVQAWWAARLEGAAFGFNDFFANADSYNALLGGAFWSLLLALVMVVATRLASLRVGMDATLTGMARVLPAIVVLVLAWALSAVSQALDVGGFVAERLIEQGFSLRWLPLAVFISSAGVSFATGTSWGTMGILCPMVVRVAAPLGEFMPPEEALALFYASVGSVLAGSIFGDHCSPISDTTVLSSLASSCPLEDHVWTQLPYAAVTALVAMVSGELLCAELGLSPFIGIAAGTVAIVAIFRVFGRRVEEVSRE